LSLTTLFFAFFFLSCSATATTQQGQAADVAQTMDTMETQLYQLAESHQWDAFHSLLAAYKATAITTEADSSSSSSSSSSAQLSAFTNAAGGIMGFSPPPSVNTGDKNENGKRTREQTSKKRAADRPEAWNTCASCHEAKKGLHVRLRCSSQFKPGCVPCPYSRIFHLGCLFTFLDKPQNAGYRRCRHPGCQFGVVVPTLFEMPTYERMPVEVRTLVEAQEGTTRGERGWERERRHFQDGQAFFLSIQDRTLPNPPPSRTPSLVDMRVAATLMITKSHIKQPEPKRKKSAPPVSSISSSGTDKAPRNHSQSKKVATSSFSSSSSSSSSSVLPTFPRSSVAAKKEAESDDAWLDDEKYGQDTREANKMIADKRLARDQMAIDLTSDSGDIPATAKPNNNQEKVAIDLSADTDSDTESDAAEGVESESELSDEEDGDSGIQNPRRKAAALPRQRKVQPPVVRGLTSRLRPLAGSGAKVRPSKPAYFNGPAPVSSPIVAGLNGECLSSSDD
jgi:hypothetical protein